MIVETEGGVCWISTPVQRPNRKMAERPVHWTWLHGTAAPTAEQLKYGRRAAQTRAAREAEQLRLAWSQAQARLERGAP